MTANPEPRYDEVYHQGTAALDREARRIELHTIISGGQTGVDRGALDAALSLGISVDGWCPRGRRAEDGPIPRVYPLRETPKSSYQDRTRLNVEMADATLILHRGRSGPGTALTRALARQLGNQECLMVDIRSYDPREVAGWLSYKCIKTLNVAGPRESSDPGIQKAAEAFLIAVLGGEK